jgi:hypothetical protein
MSRLTEEEVSAMLDRAVPEPPLTGDRAATAREGARRVRLRRRAVVTAAAVAAGAAVVLPSLLVRSGGRPPVAPPDAAACLDVGCDPATLLAVIKKPLRLPSVGPTQPCPVSETRRLPAGAGFSESFTARGKWPFYMAGSTAVQAGPSRSTADRGRWRDPKVIWVVDETYVGPLLVRGARIDRPGPLRFLRYIGAYGYPGGAGDDRPAPSLLYDWSTLKATPAGTFHSYPSGLFLREPGCYALQVDGIGVSSIVVFQVTR